MLEVYVIYDSTSVDEEYEEKNVDYRNIKFITIEDLYNEFIKLDVENIKLYYNTISADGFNKIINMNFKEKINLDKEFNVKKILNSAPRLNDYNNNHHLDPCEVGDVSETEDDLSIYASIKEYDSSIKEENFYNGEDNSYHKEDNNEKIEYRTIFILSHNSSLIKDLKELKKERFDPKIINIIDDSPWSVQTLWEYEIGYLPGFDKFSEPCSYDVIYNKYLEKMAIDKFLIEDMIDKLYFYLGYTLEDLDDFKQNILSYTKESDNNKKAFIHYFLNLFDVYYDLDKKMKMFNNKLVIKILAVNSPNFKTHAIKVLND